LLKVPRLAAFRARKTSPAMPSRTKMPTSISTLFLPIRRFRCVRGEWRPTPLRRREHERGEDEVHHQHAERGDDDGARRAVGDALGSRLGLVALVERDEG